MYFGLTLQIFGKAAAAGLHEGLFGLRLMPVLGGQQGVGPAALIFFGKPGGGNCRRILGHVGQSLTGGAITRRRLVCQLSAVNRTISVVAPGNALPQPF